MECLLRFTSYFVLLFIILYSMLLKGLKMVASVLWRSEVLRVGPWLRPKTYRVSDQGTTLRASDLHNAQAAIFNPFTLLVLFHTEANKTPFLYQNHGVIQYYFVFFMWTLWKYTIVRIGCFRKKNMVYIRSGFLNLINGARRKGVFRIEQQQAYDIFIMYLGAKTIHTSRSIDHCIGWIDNMRWWFTPWEAVSQLNRETR